MGAMPKTLGSWFRSRSSMLVLFGEPLKMKSTYVFWCSLAFSALMMCSVVIPSHAEDGHHPLLDWIGGYLATACEHHQSVTRVMQATIEPSQVEHEVTGGWKAFEFCDEPYYNNYFEPDSSDRQSQILAIAQIPPYKPQQETVAW